MFGAAAKHHTLTEVASAAFLSVFSSFCFCEASLFSVDRPTGSRSKRRKVYPSAVGDKVMENCTSEKRLDGAADGGAAVPIP